MPSLAVMCPNPKDATSFYRGLGPLGALRKQVKNLSLTFAGEYNWSVMGMVDALFVQRPYTRQHLNLIEMAKASGVPVWLDYDDDLFNVPTDNPAHRIYGTPEASKAMIDCVKAADIITVSTYALHERFSKINVAVVVIPNAYNDFILEMKRPEIMRRRHPLVLWRGSATHVRDLMGFSGQIDTLFRNHPEWTWNFMGYNPWFITDVLDSRRCLVTEALDPIEYFEFISKIQAALQIVPLHDSQFNRGKSNIAMIEGAYAGSVTIAPAWEEWSVPGVIQYKNASEFQDLMRLTLTDKKFPFHANAQLTWQYILDKLRLSKVNKKRHEILQMLFDRGKVSELAALPDWRS